MGRIYFSMKEIKLRSVDLLKQTQRIADTATKAKTEHKDHISELLQELLKRRCPLQTVLFYSHPAPPMSPFSIQMLVVLGELGSCSVIATSILSRADSFIFCNSPGSLHKENS